MTEIKQKEFQYLGLEYHPLDFYDPEIEAAPDVLPQVKNRKERYGASLSPETAKLKDSEKKALEALINKGYEIYRNGWPDFLAVNPKTGKAFFVEVKSNGDTLRKEQVGLHNLLLDYFHLHVMVIRVVAGYVPDFFDPEFDVEKYHAMQLDKCKEMRKQIVEDISIEKERLEEVREEYKKRSTENEKAIEEMRKETDEQMIKFQETERLLLAANKQRQEITEIEQEIKNVSGLIKTALESLPYYTDDEEKIVKFFDRYVENTTDKLSREKQSLEDAIRKLKNWQKKNQKKEGEDGA